MSHLSNIEVVQCIDQIYEFLFGADNYRRWCSLKECLNLPLESSFVSYVLDVVELHRGAVNLQESGNLFSKQGCDDESGDASNLGHNVSICETTAALLSSVAAVGASTDDAVNMLLAPLQPPVSDSSDGEPSMYHLLPPPPVSSAATSIGLPQALFEERAIEHVDLNDSNDAVDASFGSGGDCGEQTQALSNLWLSASSSCSSVPPAVSENLPLPGVDQFPSLRVIKSETTQGCGDLDMGDLTFPAGKDGAGIGESINQASAVVSCVAAPLDNVTSGEQSEAGTASVFTGSVGDDNAPTILTGHINQPTNSPSTSSTSGTHVQMIDVHTHSISLFPSQFLTSVQQQLIGDAYPGDITGRGGNCCPLCQKCVRNRSYLKTHLSTVHFGQKPHQCEYCQARFTRNSTFRQHIRAVHLQVKPHKCEHCEQSFATASNLRSHVKAVHVHPRRKHVCTVCGIQFAKKKKRLEHEMCHA